MNHSFFAVFPGQGSQHVGMAKDLFENFPVVKETFEEASDAIRLDIKKLCFEGPETDLTLTENTQPCLLTTSVAAFRAFEKEHGFIPGAVAGHSLGEYSALVAVGSIDFSVAVQWVRQRGSAMQRAVPGSQGTMAAILGLDDALVGKLCERASAAAEQKRQLARDTSYSVGATVEPANYNAPGQVVIAGSTDGVQEAIALIKAGGEFAGGKAIPLNVSAPFHCRLMSPAGDRMAEIFAQATASQKPKNLKCPYVPNRTGRLTRESGIILDLLVEQVDHPVLWRQSVESLLDAGFRGGIEFGPGKVLTGLIKRIAANSSKNCLLASINDTASIKSNGALLKS